MHLFTSILHLRSEWGFSYRISRSQPSTALQETLLWVDAFSCPQRALSTDKLSECYILEAVLELHVVMLACT